MVKAMNGIPSNIIEDYWPIIENSIKRADKKADFLKWYPLEFVKTQLLEAKWQCWKEDETFFLTCITIYPSGYKEFEILLVCGDGIEKWDKAAWKDLRAFAKYYECNEVRFQGRPGWQRYGRRHEPALETEYRYRVKL
jgi:hypothetical protein